LKKLIIKPEAAHVIFKVEKFNHMAEITMVADGVRYVVHHTSNDMYTSIDSACKKLEKQLRNNKERVKNHKTGMNA
jgi:putative sigma-54 modulation protein